MGSTGSGSGSAASHAPAAGACRPFPPRPLCSSEPMVQPGQVQSPRQIQPNTGEAKQMSAATSAAAAHNR